MAEDLETNKRIFVDFLTAMGADMAAATSSLPDDVTWWTPGGIRSKSELLAYADVLRPLLAGPMTSEVVSVTADEDRVAIEMTSETVRTNGTRYRGSYHMLVRLRDGQIREVREHYDTAHAAAVWADLL